MPDAICRFEPCGKTFAKKRPWQDFCNPLCRTRYWNLKNPRINSLLKVLNDPEKAQFRQRIEEQRKKERPAPKV